jgi:hypothetical protein
MTANIQAAFETADARPVFRILSKPFDIRQLVEHVRECHEISGAPEQARDASSSPIDV